MRKVDSSDSLAVIGNGHRASNSIQLESRVKYEGMVETRLPRELRSPRYKTVNPAVTSTICMSKSIESGSILVD